MEHISYPSSTLCALCGQTESVLSAATIEPDPLYDDARLLILECEHCHGPFRIQIIESEQRGALDDDGTTQINATPLSQASFSTLIEQIKNCPDTKNEHCACPFHLSFQFKHRINTLQSLAR